MKTRRMKGGGYRSTSSMNAFINTHSPSKTPFTFQGIIKLDNTQRQRIIFVTPDKSSSKGVFGGVSFNIQCSVDDFNYFHGLTQITSTPNSTEIEFIEVIDDEFKRKFTQMEDPPPLPPAAIVPSPTLQPDAPARTPMVRTAINSSIVVTAEDVLLGKGYRPIFMKFNEDEFAHHLYNWIFTDEDEFLMSFAVPNICFWTTRLSASEYLSPGELAVLMPQLGYPFTPDMFTLPFSPEIKTFLKSRPFRLRTLLVTDLGDGYGIQSVQFHEQKSYLPGFAFNYCDFDGNCPVGVPPDIYDSMIQSALSSCTVLEKMPARLISIDLYLNRHQPIQTAVVVNGLPSVPSGFHSDSGTGFSDPTGASNPSQAELLTHAKIVSIMEPQALSKSVSIMANISTTEDTAVVMQKADASMDESVKIAAAEKIRSGNYRNVITFISKNGTSCLFDDELIYHSSPWNDIPTTDTNVTQGLFQPSGTEEIGISGPTLLTQSLTQKNIDEIRRDKQRCLFRVHYSNASALKNEYEFYPGSAFMKYGLKGLMITEKPIVININRTPDGNVDLSELNDAFGPTGPLKSKGLGMGGKRRTRKIKRRKRKTRGGTLEPSILDNDIIVTVNNRCAPQGCVITGIN